MTRDASQQAIRSLTTSLKEGYSACEEAIEARGIHVTATVLDRAINTRGEGGLHDGTPIVERHYTYIQRVFPSR